MNTDSVNDKTIRNITLSQKGKIATVEINPDIFSLKIVFQAAYVFMDRAYILIDGDPKKKIVIQLEPLDGSDPLALGNDFNNELLNYAVYNIQSERTMDLRKLILGRALLGNIPNLSGEKLETENPSQKGDYQTDPLGIRSVWKAQPQEATQSPENNCSPGKTSSGEPEQDDYLTDPLGIRGPWKDSVDKTDEATGKLIATKRQKAGAMKRQGLASSYKISKEESNIEINLAIYSLESVILVAEEFRQVFWVNIMKVTDDNSFISVSLKPKQKGADLKASTKEFFNYLVGVKKNDSK